MTERYIAYMIIKNAEIVHRQVGSIHFLVDPRISYNSENENLFQTDEIGACIWECISSADSFEDILYKVLGCFQDEKTDEFISMVCNDVEDYLSILLNAGYILEV